MTLVLEMTQDRITQGSKPVKIPAKVLTPAQKAARTKAANRVAADALTRAETQQLAQIINLHIGGYSLEEIGLAIGKTSAEVQNLIDANAARYVRSQPALRTYIRNYISKKYTELLDAIYDDATDMTPAGQGAPQQKLSALGFDRKLASQDRAIKILVEMAKLHGANAPVQAEIKVETAPEEVDRMVRILSAQQGLAFDDTVFDKDVFDAEWVEEVKAIAELVSRNPESTDDQSDLEGEIDL